MPRESLKQRIRNTRYFTDAEKTAFCSTIDRLEDHALDDFEAALSRYESKESGYAALSEDEQLALKNQFRSKLHHEDLKRLKEEEQSSHAHDVAEADALLTQL